MASGIDGVGKKGYSQSGDVMRAALSEQEFNKAAMLRSLVGGDADILPEIDGAVDDYRGIELNGTSWCVVCANFTSPLTSDLGKVFFDAMLRCAALYLRGIHVEITCDAENNLIMILQADGEQGIQNAVLRQFVRNLGICLEREKGVETRIGFGAVCASKSYLAFSKAEAMRTMTRYNVTKTIQSILTYISINYSDPDLTNGQIAKENFLNYSYLCNQFKLEMGVTLNHYIQEFRMKTAADLLTLPNRNILEIARMVGFTDVKYFSKCFKSAYGVTPNQYKILHKKDR